MSGSFESVRWNACGMESELMPTPREKSPIPEAQKRIKPTNCIMQDSEPNTQLTTFHDTSSSPSSSTISWLTVTTYISARCLLSFYPLSKTNTHTHTHTHKHTECSLFSLHSHAPSSTPMPTHTDSTSSIPPS